ncbi:hypothetical protein [Neorhodopirellula lusitana]|uniref:hypothetical protein n=1 Tax=Neorhodopirellula lusitana TaxID=445327 RepID=UPI00384F4E8E
MLKECSLPNGSLCWYVWGTVPLACPNQVWDATGAFSDRAGNACQLSRRERMFGAYCRGAKGDDPSLLSPSGSSCNNLLNSSVAERREPSVLRHRTVRVVPL